MTTVNEHIRNHLLERVGIFKPDPKPSLESLKKTEWSSKFEQLMRNRLIVGAFRYGLINEPGKKRYDRTDSIRQRLDLYNETGNAEHLVDIANLCLMEFEEPNHKRFHFKAQDDVIHAEESKGR